MVFRRRVIYVKKKYIYNEIQADARTRCKFRMIKKKIHPSTKLFDHKLSTPSLESTNFPLTILKPRLDASRFSAFWRNSD